MPVQFTTDLPDVTSLALDASNAETLIANWGADINNGEFRIELRDDDPSGDHPPYQHEATIAWDSPYQYTIENILGGEQYSVRIRTQTEHVTGSWMSAEELTKLLASSDVTFANVAETTLDVQWTINNDFRGSHQVYRQRSDYDFDDSKPFSETATLAGTAASDSATYTDDGVAPTRPYEYMVRTLTQWQYADSAVAGPVETADAGLVQSSTGSSGWHVEIDHRSGTTITPQILDDARFEPRVNDLPRVRIPVPRDEAYTLEAYEGATMRVWKDGERQPIDELQDVILEPGLTELVGIGGTQLQRRVESDVAQEAAHILAEDLVTTETDYTIVADEPNVEEVVDQLLQEGSTDAGLSSAFGLASTDPFIATNGGIEATQTLFPQDAGNSSFDVVVDTNAGSPITDSELTDGYGRPIDESSDYVEFAPFTLTHDILEGDVGIAIRWKGGTDPSDVRANIHESDGTEVGYVDFDTGSQAFGPLWDFEGTNFGTEWNGGDLTAGDYYVRIEGLENSSDGSLVDLVCLFDRRFHNENWDNTLHESGGHLDGSSGGFWLYPGSSDLETSDFSTIYSVETGYGSATWNDTSGNQAMALSNDSGRTWTEATNASSVTASFSDLGASLRLRITVGAHEPNGTRDDASPRNGYAPQRLEDFELRFDGDDTPLIINDSQDGDLVDILSYYADRSDSLFEIRADGDQTVIHWAQAGQRSSGADHSLASYSVTKRGDRALRCTVKGGARSTRETVDATLGSAVALEEDNLVPGTEAVRDAETGENYEFLRDYEIANTTGEITPLSSGAISGGQTLEVEYDFKVSGSYEYDAYAGDPRYDWTETINGITTERGCELAAKLIVDTTSTPRWEADVEIPATETVDGLLEALDVDGIAAEAMSVYSVDVTPEQLSLRLGSRQQVAGTVRQIQDRVSAASDRV